MPIRLNLLAEAQAQEDMRRRDPVKRVIAVGALLLVGMIVWSLTLFFKSMVYKNEISNLEADVKAHEDDHKEVISNMKRLAEINQRLTAIQKISTNRFLVGSMLDALQHATLEDVQLSRLRLDETLTFVPEVKGSTNNAKRLPKPATVTEKITLYLDAKDSSATPGDLVPKFQQVLADYPYFVMNLDKSDPQRVRLKEGSYGSITPGPNGKPFRPFTLEVHFPEKIR